MFLYFEATPLERPRQFHLETVALRGDGAESKGSERVRPKHPESGSQVVDAGAENDT